MPEYSFPPATLAVFSAFCLFSAAAPVAADEGKIEINATCATSTGCFPGDTPGYPVTITSRGSYVLTGSLSQTVILGVNTASTAIEISSSDVQLDLSGFTVSCTLAPAGTCSGTAHGIHAPGAGLSGIRVSNGVIRGMASDGISIAGAEDSFVEGIQALENGDDGIEVGNGARVDRCIASSNSQGGINGGSGSAIAVSSSTARLNGTFGIELGGSSRVSESVADQNGSTGIATGAGAVVSGNVVRDNTFRGISTLTGSSVTGNSATNNNSDGIFAGSTSIVWGNSVFENGGIGIRLVGGGNGYRENVSALNTGGNASGGTDLGGNLCGGGACP